MRGTFRLDYHIADIEPIISFNDGQPSKMLKQHLAQYILYAMCPSRITTYFNFANSNLMSVRSGQFLFGYHHL